ncbi:MAG: hypothetical protein ACLFQM_11710 [Fidelibacterota bacterium]
MKNLKVVFVVASLIVSLFAVEGITLRDFKEPKPSVEDINHSNHIYAMCLEDYPTANTADILMIIVKQKILVPEANFESLLKPLKDIITKTDDRQVRKFAMIAYLSISTDYQLNIDKDQLYNKDVEEFFSFINFQLPKELVVMDNF